MKQKHTDYKVVPNPKLLRWFAAAFRSAQHTPMMHGLLEVDVTRAREFLREQKATTGGSLSFTAFLIACLAKAIDEHKAVQAFRLGSKRLILFEEVDVFTFIERDVDGQVPIMPTIIRAANRKTVREIHHEIRAAQTAMLFPTFRLPLNRRHRAWDWSKTPGRDRSPNCCLLVRW